MDKELLKGSIDIIILALTSGGDVYGYEITKKIKNYTNSLYEMGEGTLYPALKRLEEKNFLTSYWGEADKGGRRKYYSITKEGKEELAQKLKNWKIINALINDCIEGESKNDQD
jgi:PadR family transcriptional regulator, regulatory protein PadR